jgi:N-acetylneuraminate synthase
MKSEHVYVIAEAGVNHNGQRELAFELIEAAAKAGADAVKFQTFDASKLALDIAPKAAYQKESTEAGESQLEMLKKLELPRAWHSDLKRHCQSLDLEFLSTAFDAESLDFLVELGMPVFKIPSGELTNGPLLWRFGRTGRPLILSTGMANLGEVEAALAVIRYALDHECEPPEMEAVWRHWSQSGAKTLSDHVTVLHCTSQYPSPFEEVNLRSMDTLVEAFGLTVGYSDHTEGILIPVAAVARGAKVIEKHFTLDRSLPGPDHKASLEPDELEAMVVQIRSLETALGSGRKAPQVSEWDTRAAIRQQVVATRTVAAGATISRADLGTSRCGTGVTPMRLWEMVGRRASRPLTAGKAINEGDIE